MITSKRFIIFSYAFLFWMCGFYLLTGDPREILLGILPGLAFFLFYFVLVIDDAYKLAIINMEALSFLLEGKSK